MVKDIIKIKTAQKHEQRLHNHDNTTAILLLDNQEMVRRLKKTKPLGLLWKVCGVLTSVDSEFNRTIIDQTRILTKTKPRLDSNLSYS